MMNVKEHPSCFALDCYAVSSTKSEEIQKHVEICEQCSLYIARAQQKLPVPGWAHDLTRNRSTIWNRIYWVWAGGAISVVTLFIIVFTGYEFLSSPSEHQEYETTRGAPAVGLYIKHRNRVSLWDGYQAIETGDRLRLKVVPEGFSHVAVFAELKSDPRNVNHLRLLYSSTLNPDAENTLPTAWKVDDKSDVETLIVTLGRRPVTIKDVVSLYRNESKTPDIWIRRLQIPKKNVKRSHGVDSEKEQKRW